jgi:uncharacterized protein YhfF/L-amino acid N-acyltransferase YncA
MTPPFVPKLNVRPARPLDARPLSEILNQIIAAGGTTAHETPFSPEAFTEHFIAGKSVLGCLVAETAAGEVVGFQALEQLPGRPDWADIGTFVRRTPKIPGVGAALFAKTRIAARALSLRAINATIRADNASGLPYYARMGFLTYDVARAVPLQSGVAVDRVMKVYALDREAETATPADWAGLPQSAFGDGPALADALLGLILAGRKTATSWSVAEGLKGSAVGEEWVALDGAGRPRALLRTVGLERRRFLDVGADFAAAEGEGDRSLADWRAAHERYFARNGGFYPEMELWCERFSLSRVIEPDF